MVKNVIEKKSKKVVEKLKTQNQVMKSTYVCVHIYFHLFIASPVNNMFSSLRKMVATPYLYICKTDVNSVYRKIKL